MSLADDAREHLDAVVLDVLRSYTSTPLIHHVDMISTAAERYGHALAQDDEADAVKQLRLQKVTSEYYGRTA